MLVCLVGPSAAGKTTIANALIENGTVVQMLRSHTTRKRRGDSDDEYIFVSKEEFSKIPMAESVLYAGEQYGTPMSEVRLTDDLTKDYVIIAEIHGAEQFRQFVKCPYRTVYLNVPESDLIRRLCARNIDVEKRIAQMKIDVAAKAHCDLVVDNADGFLVDAIEAVREIVRRK